MLQCMKKLVRLAQHPRQLQVKAYEKAAWQRHVLLFVLLLALVIDSLIGFGGKLYSNFPASGSARREACFGAATSGQA